MLIVFGGLPGVGKTTISRALASRQAATYLRIDTIEQAIRAAGVLSGDIGPAGYDVANALAEANLAGGRMVVADCVNPVPESRMGWAMTARRAGVRLIEVEVICSDPVEHRRRVEGRQPDIAGLIPPTWREVVSMAFVRWEEPHLIVDTGIISAEDAIVTIEKYLCVYVTASSVVTTPSS